MNNNYKPIDCGYHDHLEAAASKREFVKLQYLSDIREFQTATGVINDIETRSGEEYLTLSTGEEVRLDRIVRLNDIAFPGFEGYDDYSCDC